MDNKKLALIHIVKKQLQLTDSEYRDILEKATGVRTAKDLDEDKFRKLMNYFVRSKHWHINKFGLTIKQKLYIDSLVDNLGWTKDHLDNFIHKYYHKSNVDKINRKEAAKIIEALKHIRAHQHHQQVKAG